MPTTLDSQRTTLVAALAAQANASTLAMPDLWYAYLGSLGYTENTLLGRLARYARAEGISLTTALSRPPSGLGADSVLFSQLAGLNPPPAGFPVVFKKVSSAEYRLYRPLTSEGYWQEAVLRDGGVATGPLCWNETALQRFMTISTAASPTFTYTGSWTNLGSASPTTYTGGLGKQGDNGNSSEFVDITFNGPGDLYVIYTGRTLGAYIRAEVDGSTNNATALPSNGTYRYIDTYNAIDNSYKTLVLVASGLSGGAHTLKLICTGDRNPANVAGFRQVLEGIALVSPASTPGSAGTDLPLWQTLTTYAQFAQVRTTAGRYYSCSVAGIAGAVEPTHTSGTAVDGTVTWTFMASSSYDVGKQVLQAPGSELEYAYRIRPTGATTFEDAGGILHGNEERLSLGVVVDATPIVLDASIPVGQIYTGASLKVQQTVKTTHTETATTDIASVAREIVVTPTDIVVNHTHTWNVAAEVGWFYAHMWPLLHWYAAESRYAFTDLWTRKGGTSSAVDFYGQNNPIVGRTTDYVMNASGDVLMPRGSGSVPSTGPALKSIVASLWTSRASVDTFTKATDVVAGKAMNISGTTAPGVSSVVMKMYFERATSTAPVTVAPAEVWTCSAHYGLSLTSLNLALPY